MASETAAIVELDQSRNYGAAESKWPHSSSPSKEEALSAESSSLLPTISKAGAHKSTATKTRMWLAGLVPAIAIVATFLSMFLSYLYGEPLLDPPSHLATLKVAAYSADAGVKVQTGASSYVTINLGASLVQTLVGSTTTKDLYDWEPEYGSNKTLSDLIEEVRVDDVFAGLLFPSNFTAIFIAHMLATVPSGTSYVNPIWLVNDEAKSYTTTTLLRVAMSKVMLSVSKSYRTLLYTGITVGNMTIKPSANATIGFLIDPVYTQEHCNNTLEHYGWYFLEYASFVSLWVALIVTIHLVYIAFHKNLSDTVRLRFRTFVAVRLGTLLLSVFLSSLFLSIVIVKGFELPTAHGFHNVFGTYLLTGLAFAGVMGALFAWLSDVGLIVAVILLVFQIVTCDGIYRRETLPTAFHDTSLLFPMAHGVGLLRYAMFDILPKQVSREIGILFLWSIVGYVAAVAGWFYDGGERLIAWAVPMYFEGFFHLSKTL